MDALLPVVYDELRKLGKSSMQKRAPHPLVQPTMLVHEAWLRISNKDRLPVNSRSQFYALLSKIMRDILVDFVRSQRSLKRGQGRIATNFEETDPAGDDPQSVDLLDLNEALAKLSTMNPRYVQIVEMKFFAGLTIDETAEMLNMSHSTIERDWTFIRAWLKRELEGLQTRH